MGRRALRRPAVEQGVARAGLHARHAHRQPERRLRRRLARHGRDAMAFRRDTGLPKRDHPVPGAEVDRHHADQSQRSRALCHGARHRAAVPARHPTSVIQNDAVLLGLLAATLGVVFWTTASPSPFWQRIYKYVPAIVLCYFLPALYNSFGLIDGEHSKLYFVASRYLLPA